MKNPERKTFQKSLIISSLLHLILIAVFIYGVPSIFEKSPQEQQIITFEMLPISDVVNVRNQNVKTSEPKEIQEAKKVKKSSPEVKEEEPIEETPKKEEAPIVPKKEAEIIPEKKKDPEPVKKQEVKKKVSPPKKEKTKPAKIAKKQEDVIDSILKNLEKESDGQEVNSPNKTNSNQAHEGKFAKGSYDEDSPLSITEKTLIKQQVEKNWRPPVGIANLENVQIILHLKLEADGTVIEVTIKDKICPIGSEQTCDLLAESAARAAKKASPIENLRPERYDLWKEFDLRFDPSNI